MATETVADRKLHPGTIWLSGIQSLRSWVLPAGVFVIYNLTRPDGGLAILRWTPAAIMIIVIGGGLSVFFAWLTWSKFRYGVGEREIVIQSGVFTRVRRSIPLERVQDVSIDQGFLARLFGLAVVKIETGGGKADEGLLSSVSMAEAEKLRAAIRAFGAKVPAAKSATAEAADPAAAAAAPAGEKVFAMTLGRVLLSGLFGFSLFYLAAAFAVVESMGNVLAIQLWDPSTWRQFAQSLTVNSLVLLVIGGAILGVVFGAGRVLFRDYGFTLWKEGRRFRRERGLFTRSQVVVSLPRVQLAKVRSSAIRRAFGWFDVMLQTLGDAIEDPKARQSIAPFARTAEVSTILAEAGPYRLPDKAALNRVSSRRLVTKVTPLLIPLSIMSIVSIFIPFVWWGVGAMTLYIAHEALEWRFHRYALADDLLFVTRGTLTQKLWIAPRSCGQTINLKRSLLQRWLGLASVHVDTAGAGPLEGLEIQDLREAKARELVEELRKSKPVPPKPKPRRQAPKPKAQP